MQTDMFELTPSLPYVTSPQLRPVVTLAARREHYALELTQLSLGMPDSTFR